MLKKILGISVITASLFATSINNKLEVGVGAGYMQADKTNKIDNYGLVNVRIGKYLKNNNVLRVEFEDGDSNDLKRALLNMEHDFKLDSKITPYAYLGTGMEWVDKSGYDQDIVADFGLGAKYALTKKINMFLEARALRNFGMNDNHYGAIAGINYEFGENKEVAKSKPKVVDSDYDGINDNMDQCPNTPAGVKVDTNGCAIDSDHDGVADYLDKCANTPAGVKVDTNGCAIDSDHDGVADYLDKCANTPAGVKVDTNGCAIDSDHDGVADYLDKCANTPAGVKVDTNGCAIDSDHDGVADYLDKCPNTPAGVKVDTNGCSLIFNLDVHFKTNSAEIIGTYMTKVNEFVKFLKENPAYKAEIEGYTDNRGSKQYNIKLSEKRAKVVYNYLIKSGISADRLSYKGYGPANPIADNNTKEGRELNRRVVAKLSL